MRECRTSGSVRGVPSNGHPYRNLQGHVSTENADVHGRFEGDLVVRKRLLVRSTGHVSGTITYGEIEIERGGKLSGAIHAYGQGAVSNGTRSPGAKALKMNGRSRKSGRPRDYACDRVKSGPDAQT